ncbi:Hypothetical predicted protein [Paramuricea clavata]|uniref:Uncharacterized protein n=1 Tax=Paramuricea clavata TaxID=317549 RepID=A0A6S7H0S1_PARCT|nr:Hypothetical predicted protein [Paramuricea clavata]
MAFAHHATAIIPFNDTTCQTTLENGTKCSQQHCRHVEDNVCDLGDDEDHFKDRYCDMCRMELFHSLCAKTEEMKEEKQEKAKQTGKNYFIATGFADNNGWQYQHVDSGEIFWDCDCPDTEEIIQACGDRWLARNNVCEKQCTHQTVIEQFFK